VSTTIDYCRNDEVARASQQNRGREDEGRREFTKFVAEASPEREEKAPVSGK